MKSENEKIIIIGGDHHNTLAVIRCFGVHKIPFKVIIHDDLQNENNIAVLQSKYVKNFSITNNNMESILEELLKNTSDNIKYVIPCSDLAEYTIDNNYIKLSKYYILPGFYKKPGRVCKMMDKYEQKKWADRNGVLMANSWLINKEKGRFILPENLTFPCIVKPNISAFGKKIDIKIYKNKEDIWNEIDKYNKSQYTQLIVQEFLEKDYEICAIGCIGVDKRRYGKIIKKIRENPPKGGGSLTFAKFINDEQIKNEIDVILNKLTLEGYNGLYDIEFLKCKDKLYLNEINLRHSGNGYALIKSKIDAPYIWYLISTGYKTKINIKKSKNKDFYFIDDFNEIASLKKGYISFKTFIFDFIRANAHSILSFTDFNIFIFKIKQSLTKKRNKVKEKNK